MKKLLCAVVALVLPATVLGAAFADEVTPTPTPAPAKPRVKIPVVVGVVKSVADDTDGTTLLSFVLTTGRGDKAKDVTVNVDAKTRYLLLPPPPTPPVNPEGTPVKPQRPTRADASAVKVGLTLVCYFAPDDTTKAGPAKSVRIRAPKPPTTTAPATQ